MENKVTLNPIDHQKLQPLWFGWLLGFPDGKPAGVMELGVTAEARKIVYELARRVKAKETNDYIHFPDKSLKM